MLHLLKTSKSGLDPIINFDTYNEKYVQNMQHKVEKWLKNGKKVIEKD